VAGGDGGLVEDGELERNGVGVRHEDWMIVKAEGLNAA
jgi:hypothetical protein